MSDLSAAADAVDAATTVVRTAVRHLAAQGDADANQVLAYDLAHAAAAVENARAVLDYGGKGEVEARIACAFVADAVYDVAVRILGREPQWGVEPGALSPAMPFVSAYRDPEYLAGLCGEQGPRHLDSDFEMVQDTFRRFAEDEIRPVAEHIHRHNEDIPEKVIQGLAEIGTFGLSVPAEYGGFAEGGEGEYLAMVVATEELSRGSLGVGGSLITRPEILTRALVKGGTEEQKHEWLPRLASGEIMNAVAVTEPDFGSDVASLKVTATPDGEGWRINGVKTWCTFAARADVLMLLARTDPDKSAGHRGLSLFIVPKERGEGHGFELSQPGPMGASGAAGGKMEGRAIDTIGYRGMHSYEVALDNWYVPGENLIGLEAGRGRGFYLQMEGFENGRLQTAARAVGVMQAAYEAAYDYAVNRKVFGKPVLDYQLTRAKLARMAVIIQASRQFAYQVARLMAKGEGAMEASMVKAYVCRAAEWVSREAMQIHGGMGYAEEFPVSRYFVDARVLSIFEGADEILALKVIARKLLASV
ncbi:MAG TPA: acyl-CoA dehydrogenase family protein [Acidimicrobiales bacterium]|jgi:(2S)-methylsuccinyl-CoA dehydrogenase|nr:acyl-CoA dehydrogenase family protein [Acidimicrobiales bacterium]